MKSKSLLLVTFFICSLGMSQDYFAIVVKNDHTTYNYPDNAEITIIDSVGNTAMVKKDDALTLKGDYTLSIKSPWRTEPEILKSDGGTLEVFVLPIERRNWTNKRETAITTYYDSEKKSKKPTLERKEITRSNTNPESFSLLAVFTNGLVFKYFNGEVRAWLDNKEIEVTNQYLVNTPEGKLKISFNPQDGEFWYVFEI